jgi:hypothetical protein
MTLGLGDLAFLGGLAPPAGGFDFLDPANIGLPVEGGFFGGLISHTADGNPTHALIVAPAATGASGTGYPAITNISWKTTQTLTAGTDSTFDGAANTAAMVAAGIANHPAAQFCVNLSIGGFTDWYLPSRFELDIAYFHFRSSSDPNDTSVGINAYSVPARASNYTADIPGVTTVTVFQENQPEYFMQTVHWSSTELSETSASGLTFNQGTVTSTLKTNFRRVRAFRRIALQEVPE